MSRTLGSLVGLLLLVSLIGFAQPPDTPGPMQRKRAMRQELKEKLGLTDAQQKEFQKLHIDLEKKQTQVHAKIRTERLDLKGLLLSDNPDRAAIEKGMKTVSDLEYQLKLNMLDHLYTAKAILTPEQQKIWKKEFGSFLDDMGGPADGRMMHRQGMMRDRMRPKTGDE